MRYLRWLLPGSILAFMFGRGLAHNLFPNANVPSVDALCPFGGAVSLYRLIDSGRYLQKIHPSSLVLLIGLLASILLVGGAFCGWICPFGALQDWLQKLRRKLKIREVQVPEALAAKLSWLRYLVLIVIIYFTVSTGKLWFADYDPYRTIFSLEWLFTPALKHWPAYLITIAFLISAVLIRRFWCRFLCPLGALISLLQPLGLVKVGRNQEVCLDCGKCDRVCPVQLQPSKTSSPGSRCTSCLECIDACPVKGALNTYLRPRKNTRSYLVPTLAVMVIVLAVVFANNTGYWLTSGKQIVDQKAAAGFLTAEDIRGWMTLQQVAEHFGMPVDYLYAGLGLDLATFPVTTELRQLEEQVALETEDVREIARRFLEVSEEHVQTQLSADSAVDEIKGRMTLREIATAFKLPLDQLIVAAGLPADVDTKIALKDLKEIYPEFEVSQVRDGVAALLGE